MEGPTPPPTASQLSSLPHEVNHDGNAIAGVQQTVNQDLVDKFSKLSLVENQEQSSEAEQQRSSWEALARRIDELVAQVTQENVRNLIPEFIKLNLLRGRGLFCVSIMKAQRASPSLSTVFAALVSLVNVKLPSIGELLLKRLVAQWKLTKEKADLEGQAAVTTFLAHLANQAVCEATLLVELFSLLLDHNHRTSASVEIAVSLLKESGQLLLTNAPSQYGAIGVSFDSILKEGKLEKRVINLIEDLYGLARAGFTNHPRVITTLQFVQPFEQVTHKVITAVKDYTSDDLEEFSNIYQFDAKYEKNEKQYLKIVGYTKEFTNSKPSSSSTSTNNNTTSSSSSSSSTSASPQSSTAVSTSPSPSTSANPSKAVVDFRRSVYLTLMGALTAIDAATKIFKSGIPEEFEIEVVKMIIDANSMERTPTPFFTQVAKLLVDQRPVFRDLLANTCFPDQYENCHRVEQEKMRNTARFFASLLCSGSLPWAMLKCIRLTEEHTNSSKRVFLKFLLQELDQSLGRQKLSARFKDPELLPHLQSLFPRDDPKDTRFSINYMTAIGLGYLTIPLREFYAASHPPKSKTS